MNKRALFLLFIFLVSVPSFATVIEGQHKEYAGEKLIFFRYSDPVTQEKIPVFTLEPDENGKFTAETDVTQTTFVFCDFGIYRGLLFLEPEKKLELKLPPIREKSFADQKNPYFEPVEFWFATTGEDQLNDQVSSFDSQLNRLTDKYFNQLFIRQSRQAFDSLTMVLDREFSGSFPETFRWHKKLKIKSVEAGVSRFSPAEISEDLMAAPPETHTHPAFLELFEKAFENKLSFEAKTIKNDQINQAVAKANTGFLDEFIKNNYGLNGPVAKLALIKMLHDGFYSGEFSQTGILKILASDFLTKSDDENIIATVKNVQEKLKHLQPGNMAPEICLKNTDGNRVCTNENSGTSGGKFKYLVFADTEMIVCQEHLKYLTKIAEQFSEHLEIFVVLRKSDLIEMKVFLDKNNIPGTHLVDENGEFTQQYRVKSFPSFYLLDENHKIVFRQTKAPLDGFEQQFGLFLRKELFERQRNQAR